MLHLMAIVERFPMVLGANEEVVSLNWSGQFSWDHICFRRDVQIESLPQRDPIHIYIYATNFPCLALKKTHFSLSQKKVGPRCGGHDFVPASDLLLLGDFVPGADASARQNARR